MANAMNCVIISKKEDELYNINIRTIISQRKVKAMRRPVPICDFTAFGKAIKEARTKRGESRKNVSDDMDISPRYLANIENKGQQPSLQIFYELVTRYDISVDQYFFPDKSADKSTMRRQLDTLLDSMSDDGLEIVTATAQKVVEVEKKHEAAAE